MKFSVLINNCNYGRFVSEAVESSLAQTYPAHEIIVVDDGSTDDSLEILRTRFGTHPKVRVVSQENRGHTATIGRGISCATGDIVCILDSDDRYKPQYLEALEAHYRERPYVDLTFCYLEAFGDSGRSKELINNVWLNPQRNYDYGYSALLAGIGNYHWIGNICSSNSMRILLARTLQLEETARRFYHRGNGEYCFLSGASLLGARKFYLHQTLVEYRVHGKSLTAINLQDSAFHFRMRLAAQNWLTHYKLRSGITDEMYEQLNDEMVLIPDPDPIHLEAYKHVLKVTRQKFHRKPPVPRLRRWERKFRAFRKGLFQSGNRTKP